MKFALALVAVLAVFGVGQAHKLPNFGKGPLHEDFQDLLDLVPYEEISDIASDYLVSDSEVQAALKFIQENNMIHDLMADVEAIPEVLKLLTYLQKEGIQAYEILNAINRMLGLKEINPPSGYVDSLTVQRTGGIAGLVKDIRKVIDYDSFIHAYAQKLQTSTAFANFVKQLKSNNFQQIVNKLFKSTTFQLFVTSLKTSGVNMQLVADLMYIVLDITVPKQSITYIDIKQLVEDILDFFRLIPQDKFTKIIKDYFENDKKVQETVAYIMTDEFQDQLRKVRDLPETKALEVYIEKVLDEDVFNQILEFYQLFGMEMYMPSQINDYLDVQKVGEGLNAMLNDLEAVLPNDKIQALYQQKMKTSKAFSTFVNKMTNAEAKKLFHAVYNHPTFKQMASSALDHGLDLKAFQHFSRKIIPIPEI